MVALVEVVAQRAGECGDDRLRRVRAAALLDPRVVVGGHARERRHLLPTQAGGAAAHAVGQPDVGGA